MYKIKKIISLLLVFSILASISVVGLQAVAAETPEPEIIVHDVEGTDPDMVEGEVLGIVGDVNGSESINVKDATDIQKYSAKLIELDEVCLLASDVDDSKIVNVKDATIIQKWLAKYEVESYINHLIYIPIKETTVPETTVPETTVPETTIVTDPATSDEMVPENVAAILGIDPNEYDSDEDGLSNYVEIYYTGTDPKMSDSDKDGISDAYEDADNDGLTNIYEIELGTCLYIVDTDGDGLDDCSEVQTHKTDALLYDTDSDGLCDGDEVALGLDPFNPRTDGENLDSERVLAQKIIDSNIADELMNEDAAAIPELELVACGNINNSVTIAKTASVEFSDSRAVVGNPIDIDANDVEVDGTLTFKLDDLGLVGNEEEGGALKTNLICKYDDDGSTVFMNTVYDFENNKISTSIDSDGTYFVIDIKNLFDELGLALPEFTTEPEVTTIPETTVPEFEPDSTTIPETTAPEFEPDFESTADEYVLVSVGSDYSDKVSAGPASSTAMAQADIVFLIDTTGSMGDEIYNVKENIGYFVDALKEKGISAGMALIDYQDITVDGYDSTNVHKNGLSNWFYDIDKYKQAIAGLDLGYGGDDPECAVDALETGRLLDMRASAGKIFVLVTDADYKYANRYGIDSMDEEIQLLKNAGITCAVVSPYEYQSDYYDLYTETNGVWADIYGDFYSELMALADKIGTEIVGDGHWIYLHGPVPVPVRLDEEPYEGSTVDTDKDGKPDVEELKSLTPYGSIDLDKAVTEMSDGRITGTNYGTVMMYEYFSNPVKPDTDYDGVNDKDDANPKSAEFSGSLFGEHKADSVSYELDFRDFFVSNKTYNKELAAASLVFANTIYSSGGFKYSSDGKTISDIEEMMQYHGFGFTDSYDLNDYYYDDDVSEIALGLKKVEYNGQSKQVVVAVVRGTNSSTKEWSSNFDMGDPDTWDETYHRGFYITEERLKEHIDQYVEDLMYSGEIESDEITYWVTGHSRGAAIANILAARLIDEGNEVYAYTFATPATSAGGTADYYKYSSIFNFANTSDVVSYVPLEQWGFERFGVTLSSNIKEMSLTDEWCEQTGRGHYAALDAKLIRILLNRIYTGCSRTWSEVYEFSGKQKISYEQYGYLSARAKKYCVFETDYTIFGKEDGYKMYPSLAFVMQVIAEALAQDDEEETDIKILTELINTKYGAAVVLFLYQVLDSHLTTVGSSFTFMIKDDASLFDLFTDTHAPATYYVLLNKDN